LASMEIIKVEGDSSDSALTNAKSPTTSLLASARMRSPVRLKPRKWRIRPDEFSSDDEDEEDAPKSPTPEKFAFHAANFSPDSPTRAKNQTNSEAPATPKPKSKTSPPSKKGTVSPLPLKIARRLRPAISDLRPRTPGMPPNLVHAGWDSASDTETPVP